MRRAFIGLCGVVLVALLGVVALGRLGGAASGEVYTVPQVLAGLRQHPQAWAGRTVELTGAVAMEITGGCASSAPACTPPAWVYLGPERMLARGPQQRAQRAVMQAQIAVMLAQQQAVAMLRSQLAAATLGSGRAFTASQIPGTGQMLLLRVPSGATVGAQMRRPLPDGFYDLPVIGEPLSRLFPWETRLIVKVRLTPRGACSPSGTVTCPEGFVLPS